MREEVATLQTTVAQLRGLEHHLKQHLLGQDEACDRISQVIWQGELGLQPERSPRGSALLIGPTGTGKTEMIRKTAEYLFAASAHQRLHCYDMANYRHEESLSLLIGEAGQAGLWGEHLERIDGEPGIFLFDEVEKSHPSVLALFLAMLDTGTLCCADGRRRSLSPHYLFFTSNLASADLVHMEHLPTESRERFIGQQLESSFSPELTARLQTRILFAPISRDVIGQLTARQLDHQLQQIGERLRISIRLHQQDVLQNWIHSRVAWAYSRNKLGARIIRDTVARLLKQSLIHFLQQNDPLPHQPLWLFLEGDHLCFNTRIPTAQPQPTLCQRLQKPSKSGSQ